jgi:hypothetical protein
LTGLRVARTFTLSTRACLTAVGEILVVDKACR